MTKTGAEYIVDGLLKNQVKVVFVYPGGTIAPILDVLRDSVIKIVTMRHEQAAAFAADAYARVTSKVGVCIASAGPGATNLVTGIANAYCDSIPMVIITGQVVTGQLTRSGLHTPPGTRQTGFQEIDIIGITKPITKAGIQIINVNELPVNIDHAFRIASTTRPGPVLIDIPMDIQSGVGQ